jgi:phytanoyl-CoA hydroxylase
MLQENAARSRRRRVNDSPGTRPSARFGETEIAQYRRDGWVLARGILGPRSVEACRQSLSDLATGGMPARDTVLMYEAGYDPATLDPTQREDCIRKYMDFVEDAPALKMAAMSRRLHALLDQLLGTGRVLFQEMALVKPPRIGSEKAWHQDASYFRVTDPGLIAGVWIALDPALRQNGCMEVIPGSHLLGAVPHEHENDFNRCRIVETHLRRQQRIAIEMQPGDALIFHSLLHHYTAPNTSELRRRAIQFHYHQIGAVWAGVAEHQRLFHNADGSYAGCTVPHEPAPPNAYWYRGALARPVVPVEPYD